MEVDCFVRVFDFMSGGLEQQQGSLNGWELVSLVQVMRWQNALCDTTECSYLLNKFVLTTQQVGLILFKGLVHTNYHKAPYIATSDWLRYIWFNGQKQILGLIFHVMWHVNNLSILLDTCWTIPVIQCRAKEQKITGMSETQSDTRYVKGVKRTVGASLSSLFKWIQFFESFFLNSIKARLLCWSTYKPLYTIPMCFPLEFLKNLWIYLRQNSFTLGF